MMKYLLVMSLLLRLVTPMENLEQPNEHAFVSKVEMKRNQSAPWGCDCYNSTEGFDSVVECRCFGKELREIPTDLDENLLRITVTDCDVKYVNRDSFQPYRFSLQDVILGNLPLLRIIETGTFRDIPNLRTLYISHAPQIKFLHGLFQGVTSKRFLSLRIVQTSLLEIPDLGELHTDNIVHMIDLEGNKLEKLAANSVRIKAEQVTLNYNEITLVEDFAFNGSYIGKLSLKGNNRLTKLQPNAFNGLSSLQQLDLSGTSIDSIPVIGISEIEVLKIENVPSMKIIPSLYDFPHLREAYLTHPFHCCAFKYPEQHNPVKHAQHQEEVKKFCQEQLDVHGKKKRHVRNYEDSEFWGDPFGETNYAVGYESNPGRPGKPVEWTPNLEHLKGHPNNSDHSHLNPLRGKTIEKQDAVEMPVNEVMGTFHPTTVAVAGNKPVDAFCGNLTMRSVLIKCYPEPNALNPCEDIMGSYWLRISVWFVVVLAVAGNLAVVVVIIFSGGEVTVSRFLMSNLAFADFCMGIYLLLIASMDLHSMGSYFNVAYDWQYGLGCQVAGFLTVFASQLSVFTLTVVTVERWFAITYAIHLTRRIRIGAAAKTMVGGWAYSILMAAIPLFGVSNYSSTSICLPMDVNRLADKAFLITIIMINGVAFAAIVVCYAQIYLSLGYETRRSSTKGEMTIAKKMALLVFTDFVCWAPIAFFALTALAGYPLIGVTRSKILLVFFYPLNSCANPYLYAIMTAQYRRDFFVLLSKCGICTKAAQHYTLSTSLPTTNNSHPIPLIIRPVDGRKWSDGKPNNHVDDVFV